MGQGLGIVPSYRSAAMRFIIDLWKYCRFFYPMDACSIVWSRACKTNVTPLFLKQKQIVRIIGKAGKYEHTSILFRDFKILKLCDLFYLNDSVFMFLAYANELPYELQKLFEVNNANYPMRNPHYFKKKKSKKLHVNTNACLYMV